MLDGAARNDHDGLAGTSAEGPREVLRVGVDQGGAVVLDLGGVDEEAGHGSTHGATPIARYGEVVPVERLNATTHDGVDLAVFTAGDGAPLLLIPGLGAASSVFAPVAPDLSHHHRVIMFDPRGLGESGSGGDITMANMALDAVATGRWQVRAVVAASGRLTTAPEAKTNETKVS